MKISMPVLEELVLTSSLRMGLRILRTERALLDQNEGLGHPTREERAAVLEELDRIEALARKAHATSEPNSEGA